MLALLLVSSVSNLNQSNSTSNQAIGEQLISQLREYMPESSEEETHLKRIIDLVHQNQYYDITEKTRNDHHLTGSAIIISKLGVCLHFHKRINKWLQAGGHIDLGETPLITAQRETLEETGLTPEFGEKIFDIDVHDTGYGHVHYDIRYLGFCENTFINPPADESQKVAWFSYDCADQIVDGGLKRVISKISH